MPRRTASRQITTTVARRRLSVFTCGSRCDGDTLAADCATDGVPPAKSRKERASLDGQSADQAPRQAQGQSCACPMVSTPSRAGLWGGGGGGGGGGDGGVESG